MANQSIIHDRFNSLKRITNNISIPFFFKSNQLFRRHRKDTTGDQTKCHIISYKELQYTMDKPNTDWETRKAQEIKVSSIHRILSSFHEHFDQRIWIENVYIKLLCFNSKRSKQKFRVYKKENLSIICSMSIERLKKQNVGILFIYQNNDDDLVTNALKAWNNVLKSLKFNVQMQITHKGCKIINIETLSVPVYDLCMNVGLNKSTVGMKWRVPNTKANEKSLEFLELEARKDFNLLKAKSISFQTLKSSIYENFKYAQVLGPVDLEISHFSIETKCSICFATCQRYTKIKKKNKDVDLNSIQIPHIRIKVYTRDDEQNVQMFAIVKESYIDDNQDIKLTSGNFFRSVYIKIQLSSLLTTEWNQKPQLQILKMWYTVVNKKQNNISCVCNSNNCEFSDL